MGGGRKGGERGWPGNVVVHGEAAGGGGREGGLKWWTQEGERTAEGEGEEGQRRQQHSRRKIGAGEL